MKNMIQSSLHAAEKIIEAAPPRQQRRFLARLPRLLKMSEADFGLTRVGESAFEFWNNPVDELYNEHR